MRITPTVLASLIKPFGVPFRVTPKGSNNDASGVDRTLLGVVLILAALTLGGLTLQSDLTERLRSQPTRR